MESQLKPLRMMMCQEFKKVLEINNQLVADYYEIGYGKSTRIRKFKEMIEKNIADITYEKISLLNEVKQLEKHFLTLKNERQTVLNISDNLSILEKRNDLIEKIKILTDLKDKRLAQKETRAEKPNTTKKRFSSSTTSGCASTIISYDESSFEKQLEECERAEMQTEMTSFNQTSDQDEVTNRIACIKRSRDILELTLSSSRTAKKSKVQPMPPFTKGPLLTKFIRKHLKKFKKLRKPRNNDESNPFSVSPLPTNSMFQEKFQRDKFSHSTPVKLSENQAKKKT